MLHDTRAYLADMLKAANLIQQFAAGKTFEQMEADDLVRSAVYYQFAIIGEALSQMKKIDEGTTDKISEAWRIIGFRNQIMHGYRVIRDAVTWQIIQDKLPILKAELEGLLTT